MADDWQSDPTDYLGNIIGSPVTITSGYRDPQKNALVGGVPNSAHLDNQAYDFVPKGVSTSQAAASIAKSGIPFDQVIDEGDHVHVSFAPANRKQVIGKNVAGNSDLTANDVDALFDAPAPKKKDYFPPGDSRNYPAAVTVAPPPVPLSEQDVDSVVDAASPPAKAAAPQQAAAPEAPYQGSTLTDMLRSIPGGLAHGGIGIAGLPSTAVNAAGNIGLRLTGQQPVPDTSPDALRFFGIPTIGQGENSTSSLFGGYYQPKTIPGQYSQTAAEFAGGAAAPGNMLLRAARVLAPSITSETAGQALKGTPLEPYARFIGALLGGGAVGGVRDIITNPRAAIPSTADIKAASTAAYTSAKNAGVVVKDSAIQKLGQDVTQEVTEEGIDPTLHPKATAALGRLVSSQGDLTFKQLETLRRVANGAAGSMDKDEARIAHIILDRIDDFVENMGPGDTLAGNTKQASESIIKARQLWAQQAKSDTIDTLFERAKNRAETVGGSGLENALRVEFRALAQNAKRIKRFSPDEQDAIRQVARGGPVGNTMRLIGRFAPTNLIAMLGEMGAIAHDPKAIALPVLGTLGRAAATAATKRNALLASQTVRSGGAVPNRGLISPEMATAIFANRNNQKQQPQNNLIPGFAQ